MTFKLNSIFILSAVLCHSCGFIIKPKQLWQLENKSFQKLNIGFWEDSQSLLQIELAAGGTFDTTTFYDVGSYYTVYPQESDSIVIKFGDGKGYIEYCQGQKILESQLQKTCLFNYDFMIDQGYVKHKARTQIFKMTFTEEDYQKAKPI